MANLPENFGLEHFMEDDAFDSFAAYLVSEGRVIPGYYGEPYIFASLGDAEYWLKTERSSSGELAVISMETHCCGYCVMDMVCTGIDITPSDMSRLGRVLMLESTTVPGPMLPVEIINADVLPGYMKGDRITVQMTGLPLEINYYKDEESCSAAVPEDENGKKWLMRCGMMSPLNFYANHAVGSYEQGREYESDAFVSFTAKVTRLNYGESEICGEKAKAFISCMIETDFGEFELNHTILQVPEEQRGNIRVGAVVSGVCVVSGDVALSEYENGAVRDFENDLKLLRYSFIDGDAERLRSVLTDESVYSSDASGEVKTGADEIIGRINYVKANGNKKYFAHLADIVEDTEGVEYPEGTRCIILAAGEEDHYESIVFIDVDEDGMIERIKVSTDGRYKFSRDEQVRPVPAPEEFIKCTVAASMIAKAKTIGIIDDDFDEDMIELDFYRYRSFDNNAVMMLDELNDDPQPDEKEAIKNIFGYLFAKAAETGYNEQNCTETGGIIASYCCDDAFAGVIESTLGGEKHKRLENALEVGRMFYKIYAAFLKCEENGGEDEYEVTKLALVTVQWLGKEYTGRCFEGAEDNEPD